jgi:hypothetical protein
VASTTLKAYGTIVSGLTTELNALASAAATVASSAIDNSTLLDLFMDIELVLVAQGSARSAGANVAVYMTRSVDGTNYPDVLAATAELLWVFSLDAATTARRCAVGDVPMPPGLFKWFAVNNTGQALGATLNTLKYRPHSVTTV